METKESVERECVRLANELISAKRNTTSNELAYWLKYAAKIGYELGWFDHSSNRPFKSPEAKEVPKL